MSLEHLDGLLRDRFLSGVLPRYQGWLRLQSCDTFQEAIACCRKVEIIMQSEPADEVPDVQATVRQSATTERNSVSMLSGEVCGRQMVVDSTWKRRFFTLNGSPICLYCKRAGHVRRDCRKRLRGFGLPPVSTSNSGGRCPPTLIHDIFAMVGCRKRRPRGSRGTGKSRRPDFSCGDSVAIRKRPRVVDPIERPVSAPVFEHTPTLDYLCAEIGNLRDPELFPGSINTVFADSAVEQPKEVTLIQDGGMSPCDAETIDVPVENQEAIIEDVVNVPDLFSESGTVDDNGMSWDDDQMSIPKVGNEKVGYVVYNLVGVRPWKPILGGSLIFPTGMTVLSVLTTALCFSLLSAGFPLTKGQIFGANSVPRVRPVSRGPSYHEVLSFCPRLSGVSKPRQVSGRKPHLWRDMNHALICRDRQTTRLGTIIREGHDNFLFSRLGCVADGRPRSAEPQHYSCVAFPERCGTRLFFGGRGQLETKIVSFGQSMERLLTVNGTTSGDLRRNVTTIWNGPWRQWTEYQQISRSPYPIGDRRSETRHQRSDGVDGSMVIQWSLTSFHSLNSCIIPVNSTCVAREKTIRRERSHDGRKLRSYRFFYYDRL